MKKEFIFAGFGGQGTLLIGKFLALACMKDGKHVSWLPSYGPEMRGGTANCSVIVSDEPIASPLVDEPDVVIAMNEPSLDKFEPRIKPGGLLVINSSLIDRQSVRDDIDVIYCAMLEKCPIVSSDLMLDSILEELGPRKAKFFEGNKKALLAGMEIAKERWKDL